jgi:hypothetical protein
MPRTREMLSAAPHGLYRKRHDVTKIDKRSKEFRAWKTFSEGISQDLGGDLSFGQKTLTELAFWKFFCLSEFLRALLGGRNKSVLVMMTEERFNRVFNCTSNSLRADLKEIYGPNGLGRVERRVESLQEYLRKLPEKAGNDGESKE